MKHFLTLLIALFASTLSMAADVTGYLGDILYFTDNPAKVKDAYKYYPNGVLYVSEGKVVAVGEYAKLKDTYKTATIVDYTGRLIVPGFVDTHIHFPQTAVIAAYGMQLLDWLNYYIFPNEKALSDPKIADLEANNFLDLLVDNGTTTGLVFCSVSPITVDKFFQASTKRNMRMIAGLSMMDRNSTPDVLDNNEDAYRDNNRLIAQWNGKGRQHYAVIPRFAPTSSNAQLAMAAKLLKENPSVYLHTHLDENKQEVAWVKELFPDRKNYFDVYKYYGLVTKKSIFAHSIYLEDQDYKDMSAAGASIAFCPTSNLFLGSGLFNLNKANLNNINVGLGTDVGAGTSYSILQTMNEAYKVTQMRKAFTDNPKDEPSVDPFQLLYLATLGGARTLSLDQYIGSFETGKEADFVVLKPDATKVLGNRVKFTKTLADKLFAIEILGDDRTVEHTYSMGNKLK
jgi:guanine deaminase